MRASSANTWSVLEKLLPFDSPTKLEYHPAITTKHTARRHRHGRDNWRRRLKYEHIIDWHKMPEGARLIETPGVAVDSQDDVYAFSRNPDYPVMVFDQEGNFVRGFGKGIFGNRTHGIYVGPEDTIYCVDDGIHTITKFTRDGELLMTIGTPGVSSEIWKGEPFNSPPTPPSPGRPATSTSPTAMATSTFISTRATAST